MLLASSMKVLEGWHLHHDGGVLLEDLLRVKSNDLVWDSQAEEPKTSVFGLDRNPRRTHLVDVVNQVHLDLPFFNCSHEESRGREVEEGLGNIHGLLVVGSSEERNGIFVHCHNVH